MSSELYILRKYSSPRRFLHEKAPRILSAARCICLAVWLKNLWLKIFCITSERRSLLPHCSRDALRDHVSGKRRFNCSPMDAWKIARSRPTKKAEASVAMPKPVSFFAAQRLISWAMMTQEES